MSEIVFKGGEKLQATLREIAERLGRADTLRVGFKEDATYPEDDGGQSVAMVAAIQEFGAPRASIPPRPFMRPTIATHGSEWGDDLANYLRATDNDAEHALDALGQLIGSQIAEAIANVHAPELSEVTLLLRQWKSDGRAITGKTVGEAAAAVAEGVRASGVSKKPLVASGLMLRSIAHEVS